MSHMSHRRISAGQRLRNVGHHHAGLMSHMSHRRGQLMSLMSHMGHSTVPPSGQFKGPMGHVGHDSGPFPTWPSPPQAASRPGWGMPTPRPPGRGDAVPAPPPALAEGRGG
jgi:hypothetical protein